MASASKGTGRKPVHAAPLPRSRGRKKPVKPRTPSSPARKAKSKSAAKAGSRNPKTPASKAGGSKKSGKNQTSSKKRKPEKKAERRAEAAAPVSDAPDKSAKDSKGRQHLPQGSVAGAQARTFLARPSTDGPKVILGLGWFILVVVAVLLDQWASPGRWAMLALWGILAAIAARQVGRSWGEQPRASVMPGWAPDVAAVGAFACVAAASVGTALGGIALIALPILLVVAVSLAGRKPVAASGAVIGLVLAAIPAMSVVLVGRESWQPALFLILAVSFYDAGYFIGAAESSSRLEGPVTGTIGLLAVTFAASAFETAPFDRVTAWIAGAVLVFACPLGKMLVASELPNPQSRVPAMRRLDSYLAAAPVMLAATWALS